MNLQSFKNLLSSSSNKLDLFINFNIIANIEFSANELIELIKANLSSIDILELFKYTYYQELPEDLKNNLISSIELPSGYFLANINPNPKYIREVASNQEFVKKNISLDEMLIFCKFLQDSEIDKIIQWYPIEHDLAIEIYKSSYSSNKKIKLLTDENDLTSNEKIDILVSIKEEELIAKFLCQNPDYCEKNGITKENLMNKLIRSKRNRFPDLNRSLDITDFPTEFRECIGSAPVNNTGFVVIDLNSDLENYRGLDELINLSPQNFSEEKIKKLMKLCEICPNLKVSNPIDNTDGCYISSGKEYKEAEEWISSVISKLKPEYSKAQKIAIIDNEIGKKINFTPNQGTEYFNETNARCLWKIISSSFGVCNGISAVEHYIFKKVGIDSELVNSGNHTFLRVNDVDIVLSDGQSVSINGILDPTWNLFAHKFGGMPNLFLISYADARKQDIDSNGIEHNCHDNDKKLQDLTHSLDKKDLRQLFYSVGLTNSDGTFPLERVMKDLKGIDEKFAR